MYFKYGTKEIEHLKSKDKKLGELIDSIGIIKRPVITDLFEALINSIVGQQISNAAFKTVWNRFLVFFDNKITPESILNKADEDIQKLGLTFRKVTYIKNAAEAVTSGKLDLNKIKDLSNEEFIKELSSLNGIGEWTAEMLLIFTLQRPDILSYKDLAIVNSMKKLYKHEKMTKELFLKYKRRYSPYESVASLYLWAYAKID